MKTAILAALILMSANPVFAGRESGGGDEYTMDFIRVATQIIYPWLVINGSKLSPKVDSADFLLAINPKKVASIDHVFESCDGSSMGREVEACYDAKSELTNLSRTRYPLKSDSLAKFGLVSHEVFRKMGIEGDKYEVSRQISLLISDDMCGPPIESLKQIFTDTCKSIPNDQLNEKCGHTFNDLISVWKFGVGRRCRTDGAQNACLEACNPRMGINCLGYCGNIIYN